MPNKQHITFSKLICHFRKRVEHSVNHFELVEGASLYLSLPLSTSLYLIGLQTNNNIDDFRCEITGSAHSPHTILNTCELTSL